MDWEQLDRLQARMFEVDFHLSTDAANWNHNLAHYLRMLVKVATRKPERLDAVLAKFNPQDWLERGVHAIEEINQLDPQLAKQILDLLQAE